MIFITRISAPLSLPQSLCRAGLPKIPSILSVYGRPKACKPVIVTGAPCKIFSGSRRSNALWVEVVTAAGRSVLSAES